MIRLSLSLLSLFGAAAAAYQPLLVQSEPQVIFKDDVKVPVTLGVMSRCPDALLCESVFDHVLKRVANKVDLSLTFIGTPNASEPNFGVTCMHGPEECAGNVQELCVMKYAPAEHFWEFVQCQNYQGREKIGLPETALQCANSAKIDWEGSGAGTCTGLDGSGKAAEGVQLLQDSVKATRELGIQKSCTIMINGKQVCIHDGTWKQCENGHSVHDFVRQINEEYRKLNSETDGDDD
ncbi:hypothetical protein WOLCODRAFT_69436 [Wolfiporia cocos MD-104 SS10]|uniref:Gamma interferon inducible lysosomal thiol reductase n=1 Tax=Wolfiporia cocos (strain MD-104) TaxID=742152 RepID=A0A2H3JG40_WOLCO|nr:hypothetical protein WOLCODRAFT_69436 [Wolfiporia cocos MD-104 SS10]